MFVRIRSWHIASPEVHPVIYRTLCGRKTPARGAAVSAALPMDEKSCETCLRLAAR